MKHRRIFTRLAAALLVAAFLPTAALADNWYLEDGDITVSATESGQTVSQGDVTKEDSAPVIGNRNAETSTDNTVTIVAGENATANVTLKDANIDVSAEGEAAVKTEGEGDVTLTIEGENTVQSGNNHAGVEKSNGGELTITTGSDSDGSLTAKGGYNGAGIGGGNKQDGSNITIEGNANVEAVGGDNGAAIGGGNSKSGNNITINDNANVKATGGNHAAGIGGGDFGSGNDILIEGNAQVDARGQNGSTGIGGGYYGSGTNITIRGDAQVNADSQSHGAGIGSGTNGKANNIIIEGNARVTAKASSSETAGIGAGYEGQAYNIFVRGNAQVRAQGGARSYAFGGCRNEVIDMSGLEGGWAAAYGPYANIDTDAPEKLFYRDANGDVQTITSGITVAKYTAPTCTQDGSLTLTADGKNFTTILDALGHKFGAYTYDGNATCTEDGTETAHCERCTATDTHPKADTKLGHAFTNYVYNQDATETSDGTETAHCEHPGCTATDTRVCPGTRKAAPQQTLFRVTDLDGKDIPYRQQLADGILTVTADAEDAMLLLPSDSVPTLQTQGVRELRFVTKQASSGFALAELPEGQAEFTLTHTGSEVAFTQDGQELSGILQKLS